MKRKRKLVDYFNNTFQIELTITAKKNQAHKLNVHLEPCPDYDTLAICGEGDKCAGQCADDITPSTTNQRRFLEIWRRWHLNDMKAGCSEQVLALEGFEPTTNDQYSETLEHLKGRGLDIVNGYSYGSGWLVEELPQEIKEEALHLICNLNEGERIEYTPEELHSDPETIAKFGHSKRGNFFVSGSSGFPHPYMITEKHLDASSSAFLNIEECESNGAKCGIRNCSMPYAEHAQGLVVYQKRHPNTHELRAELREYVDGLLLDKSEFAGVIMTGDIGASS